MFNIIKSEYKYNAKHLPFLLLFYISYFAAELIIGNSINSTSTVSKVIWPLFVGFGPVIYVAYLSAQAVYENRLRKFVMLPVNLRSIAISKILLPLIPLAVLFLVLLVGIELILNNWEVLTGKIIYSCGVFFMMLGCLSAGFDLVYILRSANRSKVNLISSIMIVAFIAIILLGDYLLKDEALLGIIFFTGGILVLLIDIILFIKRKSFLL